MRTLTSLASFPWLASLAPRRAFATTPLMLVALVASVALGGCDCEGPDPSRCTTSDDCSGGRICVDDVCVPSSSVDGGSADGGRVDAPSSDAPASCEGRRACGAACCDEGEICGTNAACCTREALCGSTCCGAGEVCDGALCRLDCGANARCTDEAGAAICCPEGDICTAGRCFSPTTPCEDFIDCPAGEYCEPLLGRCLPQPTTEECAVHPSGGEVLPTLLWHWDGADAALPSHNQVMMAPMVANLTDDNGDGVIDQNDIPDVVFSTFSGSNYSMDSVLRAVSGDDGHSLFDVTDPAYRVNGGAQLALGDLDGEPGIEIVACASGAGGVGQLIAFHHDGSFFWRSDDPRVVCGQAAPGIADFDGDGHPEVFLRYTILDGRTGAVIQHHECEGTGGWATNSHSPCDYTTAADLDGDGRLDLVGGNVAYRFDGSTVYDHRGEFNDGYPAVGDLDLDGLPEVVVVHSAFSPAPYQGDHYLRAFRADGTLLFGPIDINQGLAPAAHVAADTVGGGGPPTIANVDDDPEPEIALAGAYAFVVFEPDGTLRWAMPTQDHSSRKTGSTVFDFDGDGAAEAVYSDERWLRVYDGREGTVLFCACNTTATLWEYPVVVDVNNDGHAEIVVASNDYGGASCGPAAHLGPCENARIEAGETAGTHGIRVFASPGRDWVATRRVWNQHTYHVTNVSEAGEIPRDEPPNWGTQGLNNFRLNVQPGATNAVDLLAIDLAVDLSACTSRMTLHFRVANDGWAVAPAGVPVSVYVEEGGVFVHLARVTTTGRLFPGQSEGLSVPYDLGARAPGEDVRFRVIVNDPSDTPSTDFIECREGDVAETSANCDILL